MTIGTVGFALILPGLYYREERIHDFLFHHLQKRLFIDDFDV